MLNEWRKPIGGPFQNDCHSLRRSKLLRCERELTSFSPPTPGPRVRYLQSDERSPCILFLPIENSPLFMVSGMNQESIRGTNWWENLPLKNLGKSNAAFPWVLGSLWPQRLPSPPYLCGIPPAALVGLAFGGRGRWDRSHHQPVCLQRWGAWKGHKVDEGREKNSPRDLMTLLLATVTPKPTWSSKSLRSHSTVSVDRMKKTSYALGQM